MSGRLTILPKKTYCPWKPENVERVLRDERLERERVEREEKANRAAAGDRRRRRQEGDDEPVATAADDGGHVNLFPEAREAELRLVRGGKGKIEKDVSSNANNANGGGVMPVPLGGDEAARRKTGSAPFYMRPQNAGEGGKYENASGSFRLGGRSRGGGAAAADEITNMITRDQFEMREDGRKEKMDPMSRFFANDSSRGRTAPTRKDANHGGGSLSESRIINHNVTGDYGRKRSSLDATNNDEASKDEKRRRKHRKKRSIRSRKETDGDGGESHSSSPSSSSSSEPDGSRNHESDEANSRRGRRHRSRKDADRDPRGRDGSRSEGPCRREKSRGKRRKDSKRRRRRRGGLPSSDSDGEGSGRAKPIGNERPGNVAGAHGRTSDEVEELRRRRRARESREAERERRVLATRRGDASERGTKVLHREGRYQDQFNPALSRN